uniref:G_PROTEIN_RECEP_F1_2 domain-containing protein n=1 Tax=Panagrellus redivivus TaxID=6233 RepID=A0A7E4UXZ0_PANRE
MAQVYFPVKVEDLEPIELDYLMYEINMYVSGVCMAFVCFNLLVLSTNKAFVQQYKILIALNITDAIMLISIFLEGVTRRALYANVMKTMMGKFVNSRECIEVWTVVQVYGDFSMPLIELTMGIERFAAVMFPSFYHNKCKQTSFALIVLSFAFAGAAIAIPAGISIIWPRPNVKYLCGRKAAFGTPFGIFDYAFNVVIITLALALNIATCFRAMKIRQSRMNMHKIKCYTGVAFMSMILISIPNLLSLIDATWFNMPNALIIPAPILACVNGASQFFINFAFNKEFRQCCYKMVTFGMFKGSAVVSVAKSTTIHVGGLTTSLTANKGSL